MHVVSVKLLIISVFLFPIYEIGQVPIFGVYCEIIYTVCFVSYLKYSER